MLASDNNRSSVKINDANILNVAEVLVDCTIKRAIEVIETNESGYHEVIKKRTYGSACPGCDNDDARENLRYDWPSSADMNVRVGLECVKRMMKNWKSEPGMHEWKFYAEFIGLESDGSSDLYSYQVRWSFPTPAYPEPQVTVSVFFTVEATKSLRPDCPVDVKYVFEGTRFSHRPKMPFRSKWIYDVLDTKTMMFKSFHF